jgi:ubiquinone/menaquinone biosynthesis C-methylase UbiE
VEFKYSNEPEQSGHHTAQYDQFYTRFAPIYDWLVKTLPIWRNWIGAAISEIQGPRVLEISFGTGYLMTQYAGQFETFGIDYNKHMAQIALTNLRQAVFKVSLQVADVERLPYHTATFDTVLNTMAFTAYPDGQLALSEMRRVLRPGGRVVMVDICFPKDGNRPGAFLTNAWKAGGDIIRDMPALFEEFGFEYTDREIGGYGSVHLYVATKSVEMDPKF